MKFRLANNINALMPMPFMARDQMMFMELAPDRAGGGQIDQRKKQDRVREKAMEQQQLSGIDASFLYLETAETPMHVAGLTYFELPPWLRRQFLPALPQVLRKPPAHHPDLLQAPGAVTLRP